ncbi:endonuclease [Tenacibaculum holothuriorum]|uniref:endonuclease n=1 Tax=Tenacibaculum holothuriorum TaxID=1635173 RepID=UPI000A32980A|nr:endonuclease [Tenacibaculum holothuriorum]
MIKKLPSIFFIILLFISSNILSQQAYYNDVNLNLTGISLKDALATKITNTHTKFLTYTPDTWEASKATDVNPNNSSEVLLIYGWENGSDGTIVNDRTRGINNNGGGQGEWNREHVFARSLGNPNLGFEGPGSDAHNLRPADATQNSNRSNSKFASGSGNSNFVTGGWYPGDEWKGDVARMMMYMYLRYGDQCLPTAVGVGSTTDTPDNMIDLFLQWNAEDPVSDFEKQRNTYHGNTSNTYAQGNRNPFIDNPRLATRIWGGPLAEDIWGIYTNNDTEAPTTPSNVSLSNITTSSVDISWSASTDNTAVTSYDIFVDGALNKNVTTTSTTISNLNHNTTYSFTVLAKDAADNKSAQSSPVNGTTLEDTEKPTTPTNVFIGNQTDVSFKVSWTASTDNTAVTGYNIYLDGNKVGSSSSLEYTATGLTKSTTYSVQVSALDAANNESSLSNAVNGTTTDGSTNNASELFFSEYVEGGSNNKALEIANVTSAPVDLSIYSIKRQANGSGEWVSPLTLSGTLAAGDVYVVINGQASIQTLIDEADLVVPNVSPHFGAPINFNGNDPVGLFKNDVLIDIIGVFNGGSANFAKDVTLRRKSTVTSPNTTFDKDNEWDSFNKDTVDGIGKHETATASLNDEVLKSLSIYPNPVSDKIYILNPLNINIKKATLFSIAGKKIFESKTTTNAIEFNKIKTGVYLLNIKSDKGSTTRKIIIN